MACRLELGACSLGPHSSVQLVKPSPASFSAPNDSISCCRSFIDLTFFILPFCGAIHLYAAPLIFISQIWPNQGQILEPLGLMLDAWCLALGASRSCGFGTGLPLIVIRGPCLFHPLAMILSSSAMVCSWPVDAWLTSIVNFFILI